jgi:hypothetical protein
MFTDAEKVSVRRHMGYLNVASVQTFVLGVPTAVQTQFMIEGALNKVLDEAENEVRRLLGNLDRIECQMDANIGLIEFTAAEEVTTNPKAFEKLKQRYVWWQAALGNLLGVLPNPYDFRFGGWGASGINATVVS